MTDAGGNAQAKIKELEARVLAHEKLQSRIAKALNRETWVGDLADAVAVEVARADDNGRSCSEAFKMLEAIKNSAEATLAMPWLTNTAPPKAPID